MNPSPITWTTDSAAATTACGARLGGLLRPGDLVALDGELGAGKTQFTRGLAAGLGLDPGDVSSPTFVMMHEYEPEDPGGVTLFHLDAYRIGGPDDLASLGFDAELRASGVSVVEWSARIAEALGPDVLSIQIAHEGQETRRLMLTPRGCWSARRDELQRLVPPPPSSSERSAP